MKQEMVFTETEYTNNPLYRKMREKFLCGGRLTIAEIMLNRARRDGYSAAEYVSPVAVAENAAQVAVIAKPAKEAREKSAPLTKRFTDYAKKHSTAVGCIALILSIVCMLAIIIPVCANRFSVSASAASPDAVALSTSDTASYSEPALPEASFENVLLAFGESD